MTEQVLDLFARSAQTNSTSNFFSGSMLVACGALFASVAVLVMSI